MRDSDGRYGAVAVALHWLIAAAVVVQFAWGWLMQAIPKQPPGLRADAFNVHKSVGLVILVLMLVRVAWRLAHRPPALPPMPAWQRVAARANHGLLYALLVLQPLTGYVGSVFSGYPVRFFGVLLPAWGWKSDAIKGAMSVAHGALSWLIAAAVVAHVAAALHHAFVLRDGMLTRMLPRRRGAAAARGGTATG